ncbi:hypothetical protein [Mariniflexile sp.]|uniref:hypothetical protein n=1 Tax=Mariniflexile sp. TaxID=1979402 RepID=UPI0040477847
MKYLYQTNKWLVIINAILFIIPYFGLMFLIVLGIIQLIMYLIIVDNHSSLDKSGKTQFLIYSVATATILIITIISFTGVLYYNDALFMIVIVASILLAFIHLNITSLLRKPNQDETN